MDSGRERERRKGGKRREGPHSEEEENTTKKLGSGSGAEGDISNYTEPKEGGREEGANPVGRSPESSAADYAGMTSHFSLHESIEADQLDVYV